MNSRKDTEGQEQVQQKIMINGLLMECVTILRRSEDHEVAFNHIKQEVPRL